jgi:hypothetical protein
MTTKYALALALLPALMGAQESATVTKVIHVRYARAEAVKELLHGEVSAYANNGLRAIVLRGSAASVAATAEAIKQLDVPTASELARDVELTVYVVGATAQGTPESSSAQALEPVLRQLKAVFQYRSYQLLDTMMIRLREGHVAHSDGILKSFPNVQAALLSGYHVHCSLGERSEEGSDGTVRVEKFVFTTRAFDRDVTIDTNFDMQDGQKVVVGNTDVDGGSSALFLVVSAKFVQ